MKPKILLIIIFAAIVLGIAVVGYFKAIPAANNQTNLPKIEITPQSYDFGEIDFGKVVQYTFKIKNSGQETLEIKRVATSCACTSAKIEVQNIAPGQEAEMLVVYDTAAMGEGAHGKGKQDRIIYVKTNDPVNPQVEATITAFVK